MENDESEYQEASAGPSTTQPVQCSSLRKNGFVPYTEVMEESTAEDKAVIDHSDGSPGSPVKLKPKTIGSPVRSKVNRKKLDGFACKECEDYYRSKNLTEDQLKIKINICSSHRSKFSPPESPEHFWETGFPSTPELIRRGWINIAPNSSVSSAKTKKRK